MTRRQQYLIVVTLTLTAAAIAAFIFAGLHSYPKF